MSVAESSAASCTVGAWTPTPDAASNVTPSGCPAVSQPRIGSGGVRTGGSHRTACTIDSVPSKVIATPVGTGGSDRTACARTNSAQDKPLAYPCAGGPDRTACAKSCSQLRAKLADDTLPSACLGSSSKLLRDTLEDVRSKGSSGTKGSAECDGMAGAALRATGIRHGRVEAEKLSRHLLLRHRPSDRVTLEEFRAVIELWECHASKKRKKTRPEGADEVYSDTFGLVDAVQNKCVSDVTSTYPSFRALVNRYLSENYPPEWPCF